MRTIFFYDHKNWYFNNSEIYLSGLYEKVINYFSNDFVKVFQTFEKINNKNIEVFHFFFNNNIYYRLKIYGYKQIELFQKFFNNILIIIDKYGFDREIIQDKFEIYNYNSSKFAFIMDKDKNIIGILKNEFYYFNIINTNKKLNCFVNTYIAPNSLDIFLLDCYEKNFTITKEI